MKARIISTGEIINIAEYAMVTLDKCDDYGNPIEVPFEDIELIKDSSSNIDWQQVRIQAAIAAMQLIQTDETFKRWVQEAVEEGGVYYEEYPRIAVNIADALVKELKGE